MKCPVCQAEIREDQLYCEKCGYEIRIVPDFEAELEQNIMENMSGLIQDLMPENTDFPDEEDAWNDEGVSGLDGKGYDEDEDRPSIMHFVFCFFKKHKKGCTIAFSALFLTLILMIIMFVREKMKNTFAYQYEQAMKCVQNENYEAAIEHLYDALHYESNHPEIRMMIADYRVKLGDLSEAEYMYRDLFHYADCAVEAYEKYIALLEGQERYLDICNQLASCEISTVREQYNQYLAEPPIFSVLPGEYESAQILKITANTNGIIYYTTDGSTPDESAHVYTTPIMLESGDYRIRAIFINEYGRASEIFSAEYKILAEIPNMPTVTPDGGDYKSPEYIRVEIPQGCTVYYTMDGTVPDQNSLNYSREICMPLGSTTFKFVSYNQDMVPSEINQVEYHLNLENARFSDYEALLITASGLTERGILLNMNGQVAGDNGIFSYLATAAFEYEGEIYYLMTEYYTDISGNTYSTQTKYAVSVSYGILYRAESLSDGHYKVIEF